MSHDELEARLVAAEIALDALLAEVEELQNRLDQHAKVCQGPEIQLP